MRRLMIVLVPAAGIAWGATVVPNLTGSGLGWLALLVFVFAYGFVIAEEFTHLRKSKPVMVAAGVLWLLVAIAWQSRRHRRASREAAASTTCSNTAS